MTAHVQGAEWAMNYLRKLNDFDEDSIMREESDTMYQFGGGETRISIMKIGLPCIIGDNKVILITEVVDAKIPLLIGTNYLEKAEAKLDFGSLSAEFFGERVEMFKVGSGHFCIQLFSENLGFHINDHEIRDDMVYKVLVAEDVELTYKQLKKLHHVFGHTSTDKLNRFLNRAGKGSKEIKASLEKIRDACEACVKDSQSREQNVQCQELMVLIK